MSFPGTPPGSESEGHLLSRPPARPHTACFAFPLLVGPTLGTGDSEMARVPLVLLWGGSCGGRDSWTKFEDRRGREALCSAAGAGRRGGA